MNTSYLRLTLRSIALLICAIAWTTTSHAAVVSIATVPVGDPGNVADTQGNPNPAGSVSYAYNIGTYDVTLDQYCAFLNTVAKSDPNNLYNPDMATDLRAAGISRNGVSGGYMYTVIGSGQRPVTNVSWYDAIRFCNWLTNGQGSGGTETGVYTLTGPTSISGTLPADHSALVGSGTKWFLPTLNEWYKAAYYKGGGTNAGYWLYPFRSDTEPTVNNPALLDSNSGNFRINNVFAVTQSSSLDSNQNYLTDVVAYPSTSPYGSYDMGGDVWQWTETLSATSRALRGGVWSFDPSFVNKGFGSGTGPTAETIEYGFRVAGVGVPLPEPGSVTLLALGACGFLALAWRRKRADIGRPQHSIPCRETYK